jgi:dTDP-4-dehydrorhamnose reductase
MAIVITGDFGGVQRDVQQMKRFSNAVERSTPSCNLLDPESVQAVLRQTDRLVDCEARRYPRNKMIQALVLPAKKAMREGIEEAARKAQAKQ